MVSTGHAYNVPQTKQGAYSSGPGVNFIQLLRSSLILLKNKLDRLSLVYHFWVCQESSI
jgi:hypothetical protein